MKLNKFILTLIGVGFLNLSFAQTVVNNSDDFCYAKLKTPDVYDEVSEEVLVRPASTKVVKTPAEYETISEQLMVQPESRRMIYVPATYKTVEEQVVDKPQSTRLVNIPAVTEKRAERVLVKEESKRMVTVPAVYENISERILVRPEMIRIETIPAEFETVTEKVIAKAATSRYVPVPAEYETVTEKVEVSPATTRIETLTPKMETRQERVLVKPAYTKWESRTSTGCLSADPNDCQIWCLVEIPAEYKTVQQTVNVGCDGSGVANSGCTREIPVPAKYENRTKRVLKSPATTREEQIPAEYTTVSRSVLKSPASTREVTIPAEYRTYTKRVVKTPATVREEIIPAEYKEMEVNVVISPASTREETIPATYKTIRKRVIDTPATTKEEIIPAKYETITKRVLRSAEQITMQEIPAEYRTVTKQVVREKGDMEWKRIVCPKYQTPEFLRQLQTALKNKGFNPGPIDNVFGSKTYSAMLGFQKANNMWQGHLDYATAEALGLTLPAEAMRDIDNTAFAALGGSNNSSAANSNSGNGIAMTSKGGDAGSGSGASSGTGNSGNASNNSNASSSDKPNATGSMSAEENSMVDEINKMRSNPKAYAKEVEAYIEQVKNDDMLDAAYKADEISSAKELIAELKNMNPLPTLEPHQGLHKVGVTHGKDVQKQGMIGHRGSDGTMPWDRVKRDTELKDGNENLVAGGMSAKESLMILMVDSGIPGRGHRKTLLDPKWTKCGVYKIGDVGGVPNAWIQVFGSDK